MSPRTTLGQKQNFSRTVCFLAKQTPLFRFGKSFARSLFQNENPVCVHKPRQPFVRQQFFGESLALLRFFVRRVGKYDIKYFGDGRVLEEVEDITLNNPSLQFCFGEIALDNR